MTEHFKSRPPEIEKEIAKTIGTSFQIQNFLNPNQINNILELGARKDKSLVRREFSYTLNSGEFWARGMHLVQDNEFLESIIFAPLRDILEYDFFVSYAAISNMETFLEVHVDSGTDPNNIIYKQVQIVLDVEPKDSITKLILFHQRHFGLKASFIRNASEEFLNKVSTDGELISSTGSALKTEKYDTLIGYNEDKPFNKEHYKKYLAHIDYKHLNGLTLDNVLDTNIGTLSLYDQSQLHASGNWNESNTKSKMIFFARLSRYNR